MKKGLLLLVLFLLLAGSVYGFLEFKKIKFDVKDVKPHGGIGLTPTKGMLFDVTVVADNGGRLGFDIEIAESRIYVEGDLTAVLEEPAIIHVEPYRKTRSVLTYRIVNPKPLLNAFITQLATKKVNVKVTVKPVLILYGVRIPLPEQTFTKS